MTRTFKFGAIAAAAFIAAPAFAAAELSANMELDTKYYNKADDQFQQSGRVEVNVAGKKEVGGAYVAAKGTIGLTKAGGTFVDDAWVEGGNSAVAVRLGRFEAADLFPLGKDTFVIGGDRYSASDARGRKGGADAHVAVMGKLGGAATFEFGVIETDTAGNSTKLGIRPVIGFAAGPATVKLGFEKVNGQKAGFGATVGLGVAGGSVNVNFAKKDDDTGLGLNATFGPFGAGVLAGKVGGAKTNSVYAAYTVPFFIPDASLTFAASTGKNAAQVKDTGAAVRINYGF